MRTFDIDLIQRALDQYSENILGLDLRNWIRDGSNIALTNEYEDVALFERQYRLPFSVCGHYFFHSRGKQARDEARKFLKEIFTGPYDVEVIVGLTPIDHKPALWMNKQLGFRSQGQIQADTGLHEFVILTKQEWLQEEGNKE